MSPATLQPFGLSVLPGETPVESPYANTTFMFVTGSIDVTLVFMRSPLLYDEQVAKLSKEAVEGVATMKGHVVSSITLPRSVAADMASKLTQILAATEIAK